MRMLRSPINIKLVSYAIFIFTNLVFVSLFVEAYKYKGFITKHFFIDTNILIGALVASIIIITTQKDISNKPRIFLYTYYLGFQKVILSVLVLVYLILTILNDLNFPNYAFSTFHIQPNLLLRPITLGIFLISFILLKNNYLTTFLVSKNKSNYKYLNILLIVILTSLLVVYSTTNIINDFTYFYSSTVEMLKNTKLTHDEKYNYMMQRKYGYFYDYISIVKEIIPEDSSIILPPQKNPWQFEGNQKLVRYFLFPRTIYSAHETVQPEKVDYIVVAWGSKSFPPENIEDYGWPKESYKSDSVILFDLSKKQYSITKGDYKPDLVLREGVYGLIKI